MEKGKIYFVKDSYINKHKLMKNKGEGNCRPHLCCIPFNDKGSFWLVPFSTKVDKYRKISKKRSKKFGKCIDFYEFQFRGKKSTALICNAFPAHINHILNKYIEKETKEDIVIKENDLKEITKLLRKVIRIERSNKNVIFYSDIENITSDLPD